MKHILIFSTNYLPSLGGAEIAVKEITDRIPRDQYSFSMITARMSRKNPAQEVVGNISVYRVGFGIWFDKFLLPFLGMRVARSIHSRQPISLLWSIMASQGGIAAVRFKRVFPKMKLLLTLQEGDEETHLRRYVLGITFLYRLFIQPFYHSVFFAADSITVISNYLKARAERIGVQVPIIRIPNGVDVAHFENHDSCSKEVYQGKKEGVRYLVTVSRLVEKNGVDDLISAFALLPNTTRLVIIGTGKEYKRLLQQTMRLGVKDRVDFLGMIQHEILPCYLKDADVFVRTSRSEGLGNAFLEAMASGIPVVGTPVGGITDFLQHRVTGFIARVGDPDDIKQKILSALEENESRLQILNNARALIDREYKWSVIVSRFEKEVLDKLTMGQ